MEPDVGDSLVQNIEEKGSRIRSKIDHEVEKWSDMGHTRVQLGNKLYKIKEKYKKDLSTDDIAHLQKCFMYAIQSHKNDPKSIAENISAIVPHSFNRHDQCNESWCKYLQNPNKYRPTIQLNNLYLRVELESVFMKYVEEKNVNKLAPCGSTKDNESFNNMIAQKAPKNKHFCASESLESRVMCAAAQKNLKFYYIAQINEECGLSPGNHTTKKFLKLNVQKQEQVVGEVREGVTYQTAIDIQPTSATDITMISAPITPPILNSINIDDGSYTRVFFDLETSSLAMDYLKSHKQEQLAQTILKSTYNAHTASDDVKILQKLVNASEASHEEVIAHPFCTESCIELCKHSKLSAIRYNPLKQLLQDKIVSSVLLKRIADSGLDLNQLLLAYTRDPEKGIQSVLSEKRHDGQVKSNSTQVYREENKRFYCKSIKN
ncbi:unnamed protein product [Mytilus coruscus]|uniref:Uncharacterized protein n=1 Tax=Mytilus coruscus TaxID=42192 RepID=A0A6J8B4V4_MYTCO|nr:unnamed protein product [Mytilus coruscus]